MVTAGVRLAWSHDGNYRPLHRVELDLSSTAEHNSPHCCHHLLIGADAASPGDGLGTSLALLSLLHVVLSCRLASSESEVRLVASSKHLVADGWGGAHLKFWMSQKDKTENPAMISASTHSLVICRS